MKRTPELADRVPTPRLTPPTAMLTETYVYGVERLNGFDAWALFDASARGDVPRVKSLLSKDQRLVNAQYWYQFPIHMAVRAGNQAIVKLLLDGGADPGQSRFTYNSWDKLLLCARERGRDDIESLLVRAMQRRFNFHPDFERLKDAIVTREGRRIGAVLRQRPELATASDALGNNALHWSVLTRQLSLVDRFVELGTPIDAPRADGHSPVLLAVNGATDDWFRATRGRSHPSLRNTSVIVGSLLAHGAKYTISVAAAIGDQERVERLLGKGAGLANRLDSARLSPLTHAAREGHLHLVELLLKRGADPNQSEDGAPDGRALFEACCANRQDIAALLLEHGAHPNAGLDSCGCCLTIGEAYHGDRAKPLQELLQQHGAVTPPYAMNTAQLKQALRDQQEVVRHEEFLDCVLRQRNVELLERYLDADATVLEHLDFHGLLTFPNAAALVRRLLARGLDPNRTDWLGKTFLHACAESGTETVAAVLLDAGADINAREFEFHATPLATAVRAYDVSDTERATRQFRMIEYLLKRGAATNLPGDESWSTPLAWASRRGQGELLELLKRYGAT